MTQPTISKRKFLIGIFSSILILLLHLVNGAFEYFGVLQDVYDTTSNLIYTVAYSYFFISILFLLKQILVDYYEQEFLKKNLYWIIKLKVISAILTILDILGLGEFLFYLFIIVGIIYFVIFIMFLFSLFNIEKFEIPTIGYLHSYILATVSSLAAIFIIGIIFDMVLLIRFEIKLNYKFLEYTLRAIPFIFLGVFFYKTMKEVHSCIINLHIIKLSVSLILYPNKMFFIS